MLTVEQLERRDTPSVPEGLSLRTYFDADSDGSLDPVYASDPGTPARLVILSGETRLPSAPGADDPPPARVLYDGPVYGQTPGHTLGLVAAGITRRGFWDAPRDEPDALAVAADLGGGPVVTRLVFDGGELRATTEMALDPNFRGGCELTTADTDGDLRDELIVTPKAGGGPVVMLFDGGDLDLVRGVLVGPPDDRSGGYDLLPYNVSAPVVNEAGETVSGFAVADPHTGGLRWFSWAGEPVADPTLGL